MLNFKYISSAGDEYDLMTDSGFISECNAFDYEFSPVTFGKRFGSKIYGFEMAQKEFEATLYVFGNNRKEYINEMTAAFDYDILHETPGTFVCNGYSIKGYSTAASDSSNNSSSLLWDTFKRKFICPYPFWSKQTYTNLFVDTETPIDWTDIKDYMPVSEDGTADYPWDYKTHVGKNGTFVNNDLTGSEFVIVINGATLNPLIRIGDKVIHMNLEIDENEYLTIDSRTKTVVLTLADGTEINAYGARDVAVDIFARIPRGTISVFWDDDETGNYSWTLTTYDERTAPLWN